MDEPNLFDSNESEEPAEVIDIRQGVEIVIQVGGDQVREPYAVVEHQSINVETTGRLDRTKLYVSDKEIDAAIYLAEKGLETSNCSKAEAGTQYEHQTMSNDLVQRTMVSQKFERFMNNTVPLMEEEVRQNGILENIMW